MKRQLVVTLAGLLALGLPIALSGCDREVSHSEQVKVKHDDGQDKVQKKETTVVEKPDGSIVTEKKKTEDTVNH